MQALLDDPGSPATMASTVGRYFGFVNGGAPPVAVAAAWLVAAWDQNIALSVISPTGALLDSVAQRWVVELLGPVGTAGGFASGATMANATCSAAARDNVFGRAGWDAGADGLFGAPPVTVVVSAEAHTTVYKALGLVGLGRRRVVVLAVDDQGRIVPSALPALAGPAIVCLQAGNVNSGASDPFVPLVTWGHDHGAWFHVDVAFGLWAAASPELAPQVDGLAGADSWATDAHKWLNTTYNCGIALVREADALRRAMRAMRADAAYPPGGRDREPMHFTPQSSRRARGAEVWADLVAGSASLARRFAARPGRQRRRGPQRGGAQPGGGGVRRPRSDRCPDRRCPGRRDLLVRTDDVAGPAGHAGQCGLLVDHRDRHRRQRGHRAPGRCVAESAPVSQPGAPARDHEKRA